MPRKKRNFAQG